MHGPQWIFTLASLMVASNFWGAAHAQSAAGLSEFDPVIVQYAPRPVAGKGRAAIARPSRDCPTTLTPVVSLDSESRYASNDPSRSIKDEELSEVYDRTVAPLKDYTRKLTQFANRYTRSKGQDVPAALCVYRLLDQWAKAGALSEMATMTAQFNRTTAIASIAYAYLSVAKVPASLAQRQRIEDWIGTTGQGIVDYYATLDPEKRLLRGNHRFWAGLATALSGGITGDQDLFGWGMESYRTGLCEIDANGFLSVEITRRSLALSYHLFALSPLVALDAIAQNNDVAIDPACHPGLHRLVAASLTALENPEAMAMAARAPQQAVWVTAGSNQDIAWLRLYNQAYPDKNPWRAKMVAWRNLQSTYLGGNQDLLYP